MSVTGSGIAAFDPYPPIRFESGHSLLWAKRTGDYDFHCPIHGRLFFAHWGLVAKLQRNPTMYCTACHAAVGLVLASG